MIVKLIPFFLCGIIPFAQLSAQESRIFQLIKGRNENALRSFLDTNSTAINSLNAKGYSPLHVHIEQFEDYAAELMSKNESAALKNIQTYDLDLAILKLLLDRGASVRQLTPDGYNAVQYAVSQGKWFPVDRLLIRYEGGAVRDEQGNTLLHLSTLIDPSKKTIDNFYEYLADKVRSYDIGVSTPNSAGQSPIAFYLSKPRLVPMHSSGYPAIVSKMFKAFFYEKALLTPDFSGRTAVDYAKAFNPWATSEVENYVAAYRRVKADWEAHLKEFDRQVEENKRKIRAYEASKSSSAKSSRSNARSGCKNTCYTCYGTGAGKEQAVKVECPVCSGRGKTGYGKSEIQGYSKNYTYYTPELCYKCNGSGTRTVYEQYNCGTCKGLGCLD